MVMTAHAVNSRPRQHFGRLHTPLHAFLELPAEQRSAVVWNTQIAALIKHVELAEEFDATYAPYKPTKEMPLADPFYNHAWLEAYDALEGHPYQNKLADVFSRWWSLNQHVAFDVVNQGVLKRLGTSPELLDVALHAMQGQHKENLFLKIVKKQKFLHAVKFMEIVRSVVPVAARMKWSSNFSTNDSLNNNAQFNAKTFIEAMAARLTAFGRFDTNHLDLPVYHADTNLDEYLDNAEMCILYQATQLPRSNVDSLNMAQQSKSHESAVMLDLEMA